MNTTVKRVARIGLLTSLTLVLGWLDRAIPVTWFLNGAVPGIKLGLANTVLLYGVYLLDWKSCILLMVAKVFLSGFLFGSMSAILYSLAGGVLSLLVMLVVRRRPTAGALVIACMSFASLGMLLYRNPTPGGQMLWCMILIALGGAMAVFAFIMIRKNPAYRVLGTSLAGAAAHNIGQILVASAVMRVPQLLFTYLPVLVGMGIVVGCLTGLVAQRVFLALRANVC